MKKDLPSGWKEVRLGDICEYFRGLSYNKQNVVDFGLLVLRSNNIQNYNIDLSDDELQFVNKNCNDDILLKKHDIVICMANGTKKLVGKSAEYKGNYKGKITIGAFCGLLRTKNVLLKYILQTKVYRDYIGIILAGTNINNLRSSELLDFTFQIPTSIDEQKRIADILSTFDDLIENLTKLIEKKEIYKKGVMQRVLSGEVRFNGFTDEWETVKLSSVVKIQSGYAFKSNNFKKSGIPVIRISNISNYDNYMDMDEVVYHDEIEDDKLFSIYKNDILIAMSGATTGKTSIYNLDSKSYLNQRVGLFRIIDKEKIDNVFLSQYVFSNYFSSQLKPFLIGGAQPNISSKDIETIIIPLPSIEEQKKIGELLSLIDQDIDNLKKMLQLRKLQKKGVMQKLLTGEVRV